MGEANKTEYSTIVRVKITKQPSQIETQNKYKLLKSTPFIFYSVLRPFQDYFTSYETVQSVRWG